MFLSVLDGLSPLVDIGDSNMPDNGGYTGKEPEKKVGRQKEEKIENLCN